MGTESRTITVAVRVSRHNSDQDRIDDDLVEDLQARITQLTADPKYASIHPYVW